MPVIPPPSPKNFVAITEVIPDITVDPSPVMFPPTVMSPTKVDTPDTLTLSNSVCPNISAPASASKIAPNLTVFENVAKPVTNTSSKLV